MEVLFILCRFWSQNAEVIILYCNFTLFYWNWPIFYMFIYRLARNNFQSFGINPLLILASGAGFWPLLETGSWSQEPDLPKDIIGEHALAPITLNRGNGVGLALFPNRKQIYQYNAEDKQWSVLEGVQLPKPLRGPDGMYGSDKAFLLPHDFVLSCI